MYDKKDMKKILDDRYLKKRNPLLLKQKYMKNVKVYKFQEALKISKNKNVKLYNGKFIMSYNIDHIMIESIDDSMKYFKIPQDGWRILED